MKIVVLCIELALTLFLYSKGIQSEYVLADALAQVKSVEDFCQFLRGDDCERMLNLTRATNDPSNGDKVLVAGETAPTQIAVFDACNLRDMTVEVPPHPEPEILVWPPCTRAKRCGGCCQSRHLSCQPTQTRDKFITVIDSRPSYPGSVRFDIVGTRVEKIIEHTKCENLCRTKPHHCHPNQEYDSRGCLCKCPKERLILKATCTDVQIWDNEECKCACVNRRSINCPYPQYFNSETCKCSLTAGVMGDIDIDKLLEYIDNGSIDPDVIFKKDAIDVVPQKAADILSKPESLTQDTSTTPETLGTLLTTHRLTSPTVPPTSTTTTTTTISTTTTVKPTEGPCAHKHCWGSWKPKLHNGKCACVPPIMFPN